MWVTRAAVLRFDPFFHPAPCQRDLFAPGLLHQIPPPLSPTHSRMCKHQHASLVPHRCPSPRKGLTVPLHPSQIHIQEP